MCLLLVFLKNFSDQFLIKPFVVRALESSILILLFNSFSGSKQVHRRRKIQSLPSDSGSCSDGVADEDSVSFLFLSAFISRRLVTI